MRISSHHFPEKLKKSTASRYAKDAMLVGIYLTLSTFSKDELIGFSRTLALDWIYDEDKKTKEEIFEELLANLKKVNLQEEEMKKILSEQFYITENFLTRYLYQLIKGPKEIISATLKSFSRN